uniref:3-hydroxyanthranilate 3,4-dioxygenase n=1 Tax=Parastrongyloides trichosuri TaxID=131310 RepID=A0A0N5A2R5_PARTI
MVRSCHNVEKWYNENKKDFHPPVCNKCMFDNQLKVFFVGGPNQRSDYHLEEGEEFFYQIKGSMLLKLILNSKPYDLTIPEGCIFMLPSKMEHSPQRYEDTLGLVVERERSGNEFDCLRYFTTNACNEVLFERWIHLKNVVKDLPPIINEFMMSDEKKNNKVGDNSFKCPPKYKVEVKEIEEPQNLMNIIKNHEHDLSNGKEITIYGPPTYKTVVKLYGNGSHKLGCTNNKELLIYILQGSGTIGDEEYNLNDMIRISNEIFVTLNLNTSSVALSLCM